MLNGKPAKKSKFYFSAVKWGRTDLVGKIYPPEANEKEKDSLDYYINNYYSVALNATHYKVYGEAGIKKCTALVYKMDREMGFDLSKMTFIEKQRRFFD